jgi:hypothetical protein
MKTIKTEKNTNEYTNQLSTILPRQNGTPAAISALAASLVRGKELSK